MTSLIQLLGAKLLFIMGVLLGIGTNKPGTFHAGDSTKNGPLPVKPYATEIRGAWRLTKQEGTNLAAGTTGIKIVTKGWFTVAYFDKAQKKFIGTYGGTYTSSGNQFTERLQYNTMDSTQVGTSFSLQGQLRGNTWQLSGNKKGAAIAETWEKINEDAVPGVLSGAWQIRQREGEDGKMTSIKPGPRKTVKIMSGTRFQWIAFNSETKQFFGTGGGTYTANGGKYTETIEFFSRDPSRVGMALTFDFASQGDNWHHQGLSTTGKKVNEIWEREK